MVLRKRCPGDLTGGLCSQKNCGQVSAALWIGDVGGRHADGDPATKVR